MTGPTPIINVQDVPCRAIWKRSSGKLPGTGAKAPNIIGLNNPVVRYHASYAASRILHIPGSSRNQMNMTVKDRLPSGFIGVYPRVEA